MPIQHTIGTALVCTGLIGIGVSISLFTLGKTSDLITHLGVVNTNRKRRINNSISIVHKKLTGFFGGYENVDIDTQLDFIKQYEKTDKNQDINVIIQTTGGFASSAEVIANCIFAHRANPDYKGKIKCYIANYAYSAGFLIALCCDEIIMTHTSVVCPCDGQLTLENKMFSAASIIETVDYKKQHDQKIAEHWLAASCDAAKQIDRQKKLVEKICKIHNYDNNFKEKLYHEFFSGKYTHDTTFSASDLNDIGFKIEIIKEMPQFVKDVCNQ
jgi:ClpP class serine protease